MVHDLECHSALNVTSALWVDEVYHAVFGVAFPVIITLGILTNLTNLAVLTRPAMRSKTYRWLRVLAGVDILLCLLTIPVCLANSGHGTTSSYHLAAYYAHFGWSLSIGAQILSFYLMGWFAFERYLAVCHHQRYHDAQSTKVFRRRVCGTVIFVVTLYLPTIIVGHVCPDGPDGTSWLPLDGYHKCMTTKPVYTAYTWLRELLSRLVPALTLTACNLGITLRLRQLRSIRDGFGSGVSPARKDRERQLVLLLFWVTVLFYMFNLPVMVYYLGFLNHPHHLDPNSLLVFAALSNFFQMAGNISNLLLYFLINPEFRRTLRNIFPFVVPWSSVENNLDNSTTVIDVVGVSVTTSRLPTPSPQTIITTTTTTNNTTIQLTPARLPTPALQNTSTTTNTTIQPTPAAGDMSVVLTVRTSSFSSSRDCTPDVNDSGKGERY